MSSAQARLIADGETIDKLLQWLGRYPTLEEGTIYGFGIGVGIAIARSSESREGVVHSANVSTVIGMPVVEAFRDNVRDVPVLDAAREGDRTSQARGDENKKRKRQE